MRKWSAEDSAIQGLQDRKPFQIYSSEKYNNVTIYSLKESNTIKNTAMTSEFYVRIFQTGVIALSLSLSLSLVSLGGSQPLKWLRDGTLRNPKP